MEPHDIPPVPSSRLPYGDEWRREWERAHVAMAPWDRYPSAHLIDNVVDTPDRIWLRHHYAFLASATHAPGGSEDGDGTTTWNRTLQHPATMELILLRIVLGRDGRRIVTAFEP